MPNWPWLAGKGHDHGRIRTTDLLVSKVNCQRNESMTHLISCLPYHLGIRMACCAVSSWLTWPTRRQIIHPLPPLSDRCRSCCFAESASRKKSRCPCPSVAITGQTSITHSTCTIAIHSFTHARTHGQPDATNVTRPARSASGICISTLSALDPNRH